MTIETAISIAKKKDPTLKPLTCTETKKWFKFLMGDSNGEALANGCTYAVNKETGECGWKSCFTDNNFIWDPLVKIYEPRELKKLPRVKRVSMR